MDFFAIEAEESRVWTEEQQAIFDHVAKMAPGTSLAIQARAGTGKTTTAVRSLRHTRRSDERGDAIFLAFGRKNGRELDRVTPAYVKGSTFHSLARRVLGLDADFGKIWRIAKSTIREFKLRAPAVQLAGLGKGLGLGLDGGVPDDLDVWVELVTEYGIRHQRRFTVERVARAAQSLFRTSLQDLSTVDFDDQLYLVARDRTVDHLPRLDWLYVDEAQDTNPTQLFILDRLREASGGATRIVLVGDPAQAIYGWRGAGVRSFEIASRRYRADLLTLTTSWRCPRSVVASAQKIVPDIRARPDAPEGSVRTVSDMDMSLVRDGDVVLCRNNAPLLELALGAIRLGRSVHVAGKGLDRKVSKLCERLFKKTHRSPTDESVWEDERARIEGEYADRPYAKALLMDDLSVGQAIWSIVMETGSPSTYEEFALILSNTMHGLFFDPDRGNPRGGIVMSTIHLAKGLEWDTVWFYKPSLIPSRTAQVLGGWHLAQEKNLDYVARTRARENLIFAG